MTVQVTQVEAVKTEIETGFAGLEPPDFSKIQATLDLEEGDDSPIFQELAGKGRMELDRAYLEARWSHFSYLNAEGYRYYLPALLIRCLEDFNTENPLLHPTVFMLTPRYWRLYRYGEDKKSAYQSSLFSKAQYSAVCSFLGLAAELADNYKHLAFSALRWRWNRYQHPAISRSRDYYERAYNYHCPAAKEPTTVRLVAQVERAFAATPYPGDDQICEPSPGDDEAAEYALEFRGARWQRLHPRFLGRHYPALSFFTDTAFRFFLPAYLIADLLGPELDSWTDANPIYHLTHGLVESKTLSDQQIARIIEQASADDPELQLTPEMLKPLDDHAYWHQRALEKFSGFDRDERAAIVAFLQHVASIDAYEREDIETALEQYWLPTLE